MHPIDRLYTERYDFTPYDQEPPFSYVIATTPRTGSTYFAISLWRTGTLGAPMEYLNLPNQIRHIERLGKGNLIEYWKSIKRQRTSPNGVFGHKMFTSNYHYIASLDSSLLPLLSADKVIRLSRRNKVAQAVSYSMAIRSKKWFAGPFHVNEVNYDFSHILHSMNKLQEEEQSWTSILKVTEAKYIEIFYEDFLENQETELDKIGAFFNIKINWPPSIDLFLPAVQRDKINLDWVSRFNMELESQHIE